MGKTIEIERQIYPTQRNYSSSRHVLAISDSLEGYLPNCPAKMINWSKIKTLAQNKTQLRTKRGEPFHVVRYSDTMVWVEPQTGGEYSVSRTHLDEAVEYLKRGGTLTGSGDYKNKIADDRPSYAWAILRHLGYL